MGYMSRLHWRIFFEPHPEDGLSKDEEPKPEEESHASLIEREEKERLIKEKCTRVALRLRKRPNAASLDA